MIGSWKVAGRERVMLPDEVDAALGMRLRAASRLILD